MAGLKIEGLGGGVIARHMLWYHFPIADGTAEVEPYPVWCLYREELVALVRDGSNILVHCKGGLGRAGMIAVELLASLGMPNDEAIAQVRDVRPYVSFPLSLRNVEDLLFERGIDICHDTVRFWWNCFGPLFVVDIRRQRVSQMRGYRH